MSLLYHHECKFAASTESCAVTWCQPKTHFILFQFVFTCFQILAYGLHLKRCGIGNNSNFSSLLRVFRNFCASFPWKLLNVGDNEKWNGQKLWQNRCGNSFEFCLWSSLWISYHLSSLANCFSQTKLSVWFHSLIVEIAFVLLTHLFCGNDVYECIKYEFVPLHLRLSNWECITTTKICHMICYRLFISDKCLICHLSFEFGVNHAHRWKWLHSASISGKFSCET